MSTLRNTNVTSNEQVPGNKRINTTTRKQDKSTMTETAFESFNQESSDKRVSEINIETTPKKKVTITVDEDDPCLKDKTEPKEEKREYSFRTLGPDPRFQQQNQTLRCYVMYTDFYRCEKILGEGHKACIWFQDVFRSICPTKWIAEWDELRATGRFAWQKHKTQGPFPGNKYGT